MQMLNVPIGAGVSGHVIGGVFAAAVLGVPAAVLSVALVLVIQTLLFADGGLDMLGLNVFNMAVVGAGFGGLLREFLISKNLSDTASTFSAAAISTMAAGFSLPSKTAFSANGSTARLRTSTTQYLSGDKFAPPPTPMAAQRIIRAEQKTNPYPQTRGYFPRNALQLRKSRRYKLKPTHTQPELLQHPRKQNAAPLQPKCNRGLFARRKSTDFLKRLIFFLKPSARIHLRW